MCAIFQERKNVLEMFGDEHLINSYISSVIQNEQRTFTLPKNIITEIKSSASIICDLHV